MKNTIYISGKITGLKKYENEYHFKKAEKYLRNQIEGFYDRTPKYANVINPLKISPLFGINRWLFYMIPDIWILITKCNSIFMLRNYNTSRGAKIELKIAKLFNKTIYYE